MAGAKQLESLGLLAAFARGLGLFLVHEAALFYFLFIFACYGFVLWSISDLSLFQYNDAQFSCMFEKKSIQIDREPFRETLYIEDPAASSKSREPFRGRCWRE
jgi:hypothetical protein